MKRLISILLCILCMFLIPKINTYASEFEEGRHEDSISNSSLCTITFLPEGGQLTQSSKDISLYQPVGTLPVPTRSGYSFLGWFSSSGVQLTADSILTTLSEKEYKAYWSPLAFILSFDSCGGTSTTAYRSITYDSPYGELPTPTWKGHTFLGWYTKKSGGTYISNDDIFTNLSSQTLYAHWNSKKIKLTFDSNGGSKEKKKTVKYYEEYGTLPTPTQTGKEFLGWYTKKSGGKCITEKTLVKTQKAHTLYAHWKTKGITVSFNSKGGSSCEEKVVVANSNYGKLPIPKKSGYTFKGWSLSSKSAKCISKNTKVTKNSNHTLYAVWIPNGKIKVTWNNSSVSSSIDGFEICYSTSKTFKKKKSVYVAPSKSSIIIKGLYKKKTYYIKMRAYQGNSNNRIYGNWTPVKKYKAK